MNLIFRLLRIIIQGLRAPKMDYLDTSIVTFRVWPFDMDINRHMNNARYLSLMDLGRVDYLIRTGLAGVARRNKWMPVLGASNVRWRLALLFGDKVELHTKLLCWDDKWFYIEHKVIRKDNVVACHAIVKALFVSPKYGSISAKRLIEKNTPNMVSPPMPESVKKWVASQESMRQEVHQE